MEIGEIDQNLNIASIVSEPDLCYRDVRDTCAGLYGLYEPRRKEPFRRMPAQLAHALNPHIEELTLHTSGGRVRFVTDSEYIAIRAIQPAKKNLMPHMAFAGSSGFDLYVVGAQETYCVGSFIPPVDRVDGFESVFHFGTRESRELLIHFPLYDKVDALYLGLQEDATLLPPSGYRHAKPVVFYGASTTQGACASRPGTAYPAILSRRLDFDYINLGFSGSAYGEPELAEYIARLNMCVFVMDYDANNTSAAQLERTHRPFYQIIRDHQPDLPIVMLSRGACSVRPKLIKRDAECRAVVYETYTSACAAGDRKLFYLNGGEIFPKYGGRECTVDGTHPTDFGFWVVANALEPILSQCLNLG